jgi:hypothetical protein
MLMVAAAMMVCFGVSAVVGTVLRTGKAQNDSAIGMGMTMVMDRSIVMMDMGVGMASRRDRHRPARDQRCRKEQPKHERWNSVGQDTHHNIVASFMR